MAASKALADCHEVPVKLCKLAMQQQISSASARAEGCLYSA